MHLIWTFEHFEEKKSVDFLDLVVCLFFVILTLTIPCNCKS